MANHFIDTQDFDKSTFLQWTNWQSFSPDDGSWMFLHARVCSEAAISIALPGRPFGRMKFDGTLPVLTSETRRSRC